MWERLADSDTGRQNDTPSDSLPQGRSPDLPKLGTKLKLPPGWKFRTKVLDQDLGVSAINGVARVVQDDLEGTYNACFEEAGQRNCTYVPRRVGPGEGSGIRPHRRHPRGVVEQPVDLPGEGCGNDSATCSRPPCAANRSR